MPILALKSVKKWKEKTKNEAEEEPENIKPYIIVKPPDPKYKFFISRDKVGSSLDKISYSMSILKKNICCLVTLV